VSEVTKTRYPSAQADGHIGVQIDGGSEPRCCHAGMTDSVGAWLSLRSSTKWLTTVEPGRTFVFNQ
jgi:hypothetical protein